jgi:phage terminase large subunit GpA-like protein
MDALSPSDPCQEVCLKFSSQSGKTEVLNNFVGYIMHHDPGPALIIQPSVKPMGEAWSKDRLAPMIRDTPALRALVVNTDKRNSENTILHKTFPGGHLTVAGANSPAGLASRPIRYLLMDEIDRHEATKEGDASKLAKKRTLTFWNRKILSVSSPTYEDVGIDAAYKTCQQQYEWHMQCQHCGEFQMPMFRHFQWTEGDPDTVVYVCEKCGGIHEQADEHRVKNTGKWMLVKNEGVRSRGYWFNQWASPFARWAETVAEFLEAKDDPIKLQTVINTAFAECWTEPGEDVPASPLLAQREEFAAECPAGVMALTAGVDVQQDRLEVEIVGFGVGETTWSVDYQILDGDVTQAGVWEDLQEVLSSRYELETGGDLPIGAACIDSGYLPQTVYSFVRKMRNARIWATKGSTESTRPFVEGRQDRARRLRKRRSNRYQPELIGTVEGKTLFYRRLRMAPTVNGETIYPLGYCHFPMERDEEYFAQLTAEKAVMRRGRREFIQKRPRNEALDCRILAMAARALWGIRLEAADTEANTEQAEPEQPTVTQQMRQARRPVRRRSGYVNNW